MKITNSNSQSKNCIINPENIEITLPNHPVPAMEKAKKAAKNLGKKLIGKSGFVPPKLEPIANIASLKGVPNCSKELHDILLQMVNSTDLDIPGRFQTGQSSENQSLLDSEYINRFEQVQSEIQSLLNRLTDFENTDQQHCIRRRDENGTPIGPRIPVQGKGFAKVYYFNYENIHKSLTNIKTELEALVTSMRYNSNNVARQTVKTFEMNREAVRFFESFVKLGKEGTLTGDEIDNLPENVDRWLMLLRQQEAQGRN